MDKGFSELAALVCEYSVGKTSVDSGLEFDYLLPDGLGDTPGRNLAALNLVPSSTMCRTVSFPKDMISISSRSLNGMF